MRKLVRDMIEVSPTRLWVSPATEASYPLDWQIRVPSIGLEIATTSMLDSSEIDSSGSTMVTYWECVIGIKCKKHNKQIAGQGFMELTGYAQPLEQLKQ